jgi:hypothetical protein
VYSIVSFSNKPVTAFTFSITMYPSVGNSDASVKVIVVSEAVSVSFKVVANCKVVIATPPTGVFTLRNLT